MLKAIYLDNNATTRPAPEVVEAMLPFLRESFGNPSSAHLLGHVAEGALVQAREQVAALLNVQPAELVFTSGGTEGLNHALRGTFEAFPAKRHFVMTAVEHSAVLALGEWLRKQGAEVSVLGVDSEGRLDLGALEATLRADTALVSLMAANNETGVRFPIPEAAALTRSKGVLLHVDAVQGVGKIPLDPARWGVDLLTLSGHKLHGPKGTGALWIRRGLRLKPLMVGGHQERGRRGGTENVPGWVGLGMAASLAQASLPEMGRVQGMRDRFEAGLHQVFPDLVIHGANAERLPNTTLAAFPGVEGEALMLKLSEQGVCVSTGSACTTGRPEPSHVLRAMGVPPALALATLRFSLSRDTSEEELQCVADLLPELVHALRCSGSWAR